MRKFAFLGVFVLMLVAGALAPAFAQSPAAGNDTERLYKLFDDDWKWAMTEFPEFATFTGYPGQNHRWTDNSLEAIARRKQMPVRSMKVLDSIDRAKLSPADQLNYDLYRRFMQDQLDGQRFPFEYIQVSQLSGPQADVAQIFAVMPTFTAKDYENILARLNGVPTMIDQTIVLLNKGLAAKVTPPRVTLRDVPQQVKSLLVDDPAKNPLFQAFTRMPDSIPAADQERLVNQAKAALAEKVLPAFRKFHDYLVNTYLPGTRETIALGDLPDGQAWYAFQARTSTTTNLTPKQIHEIGMAEVKRIRAEMEKIIQETGFKGSFADFKKFLKEDPKFLYGDAESVLNAYRAIAKRADPETVKLFSNVPRMPYGVVPVPEYMAKSAPAAYYQPGTIEAGRPGNFFVNTYELKAHQKWQMEALVLHEAVPGHHFQGSIALELPGKTPQFRKQLGNGAYVEGWGLYAESLGYEMGFYKDPYSKFGQLNYDMWRAVRLVLDTGIHALGWSRQQAIDFFLENTVLSDHEVVVEVDRYIVWPGQALGYKIGQLKFKELREYAKQELGPAFNLRAFHDQLLGSGALPMSILEERTTAWVAEQKAKRASN